MNHATVPQAAAAGYGCLNYAGSTASAFPSSAAAADPTCSTFGLSSVLGGAQACGGYAVNLSIYRVTQKFSDLGWADLVMRCSIILLGQLIAVVVAHQSGNF